jgi:hypothetical protein
MPIIVPDPPMEILYIHIRIAVIIVGTNPKNSPTTLTKIDLVSNITPSIRTKGLDIINIPITPNIKKAKIS